MSNGDAGAVAYLRAIQDRRSHTRRRTESISFDDDFLLTRRATSEILLTRSTAQLPQIAGRTLWPAARLSRDIPTNVKVVDATTGGPLPFTTRAEERVLVSRGLASLATPPGFPNRLVPDLDYERLWRKVLPLLVHRCIEELARNPLQRTDTATNELIASLGLHSPDIVPEVTEYAGTRTIGVMISTAQLASDPVVVLDESHVEEFSFERATLVQATRTWRNRHDWRMSFRALWRKEGSLRRVLTIADGADRVTDCVADDDAERSYKTLMGLRWFFLPDTWTCHIPVADIFAAESVHVCVQAPAGCYFERTFLRVINAHSESGESEMLLVEDDDAHGDSAHIFFSPSISLRHAVEDEYYPAEVRLVIRPSFHGGTRSGLYLSWFSTVFLLVLFLTVGWAAAGWKTRVFTLDLAPLQDTQNFVTLLILAPGLVLTWIVRQEEHALTKLVYARYRLRLGLLGLVLFTQATAFAIGVTGEDLAWTLLASTVLSFLLTIPTSVSALYSRFLES